MAKYKPVKKSDPETHNRLRWLTAGFLVALFTLLPLVTSFSGFDNFRVPKEIFARFMIPLVAVSYLLFRRSHPFRRLGLFEWILLGGLVLLPLHVLLLSNQAESWSALFNVYCFAALFFVVRDVADLRLQKGIWTAAACTVAANALLNVFQYYGVLTQLTYRSGEVVAGRLTPAGLVGDVNSGGFLFALFSIVLVGLLVTARARGPKVLLGVLLALNLMGLLYTQTLTALAGLGLVFPLWIVFHGLWLRRYAARPRKAVAVFTGILIVGLILSAIGAREAGVISRVRVTVSQMREGDWTLATAGRQPMYWITWQMIREKPITGRGLHTFKKDFFDAKAVTDYGQEVQLIPEPGAFRQAHNEFLQVWEELGIFGLLVFISLLLLAFYGAFLNLFREEDPERWYWTATLILGLWFIVISCLGFFPLHLAVTAAFVMLVLGGLRNQGLQEEALSGGLWQQLRGRKLRWAVVAAAGLVTIAAVWIPVGHWQANQEAGLSTQLLTRAADPAFPSQMRIAVGREVIRRLNRAEELYPAFHEIYNLKGTAYLLLRRYSDAEESYRRAARQIPSPEVYTNLATVYLAQEKRDRARESLEIALRYNPGYPKARQALQMLEGN